MDWIKEQKLFRGEKDNDSIAVFKQIKTCCKSKGNEIMSYFFFFFLSIIYTAESMSVNSGKVHIKYHDPLLGYEVGLYDLERSIKLYFSYFSYK